MIKTLVAYTTEIDDVDLAVESIRSQIRSEDLCLHSIGIISCHYEFIHSGAMKAICEALPFEVAGAVTVNQSTNQAAEAFLLTVMILTGDDASFTVGITPPLREDPYRIIEDSYIELASSCGKVPALALSFIPFMLNFSSDEFLDVFTRVSNGVPCFGTIALDATDTFKDCYVFANGEHFIDRIVTVFIYADIHPRFFIGTISPDKILPKPALVTKSNNNILMEVNGHPVDQYFQDLGLTNEYDSQYATASLPFLLDYRDGTPQVSKVFISHTPERYAVCMGTIPEGTMMYVGVFDKDDVLLTTGNAVRHALSECAGNASGMLMYSCVARNMSLGGEPMVELELVRSIVGDQLPFVLAYSGGELCPTECCNAKAINRFHNNTFIVCVF